VILDLENVSAWGTGPEVVPDSSQGTWLSVGAGVLGQWDLSGWAAPFLGVDGRLATSRPQFVIDGVGQTYRVPPATLAGIFGCEWIF
jgi:hypothetical protein